MQVFSARYAVYMTPKSRVIAMVDSNDMDYKQRGVLQFLALCR
jgi:hypothetical protein